MSEQSGEPFYYGEHHLMIELGPDVVIILPASTPSWVLKVLFALASDSKEMPVSERIFDFLLETYNQLHKESQLHREDHSSLQV